MFLFLECITIEGSEIPPAHEKSILINESHRMQGGVNYENHNCLFFALPKKKRGGTLSSNSSHKQAHAPQAGSLMKLFSAAEETATKFYRNKPLSSLLQGV